MPFIENIAMADVAEGRHFDAGSNSRLIQILDDETNLLTSDFPTPKHQFRYINLFRFNDVEDDEQGAITQQQAKTIAYLLKLSLEQNTNVIVHCVAGICRSGAVAAVGEELGFAPAGKIKIPNCRVRTMLQSELGIKINADVSMFRQDFLNRLYD